MLRRILYELRNQMAAVIGIMLLALCIQTIVVLLNADREAYDLCMMDGFSLSSIYMESTTVPIIALAVIVSLKDNFNSVRVIQEKNIRGLWIYVYIKIAVISFICAFISTVYCGILGKIISDRLYSWDSMRSIYVWFSGEALSEYSYIYLITMYLVDLLIKTVIVSALSLTSYWMVNSYILGFIAGAGAGIAGDWFQLMWSEYTGAGYVAVINGIDIKYQYIYPIVIFVILFFIGFIVSKRDFLPKEEL